MKRLARYGRKASIASILMCAIFLAQPADTRAFSISFASIKTFVPHTINLMASGLSCAIDDVIGISSQRACIRFGATDMRHVAVATTQPSSEPKRVRAAIATAPEPMQAPAVAEPQLEVENPVAPVSQVPTIISYPSAQPTQLTSSEYQDIDRRLEYILQGLRIASTRQSDSNVSHIGQNTDRLSAQIAAVVASVAGIQGSIVATTSSEIISGTTPSLTLTNTSLVNQSWQFRNGALSAGSRTLDIFDQTAGKTRFLIDSTGQTMIGTSTNVTGNGSRLFVYGGPNGANVDAMGDSSVTFGDQATFEAQGADYGVNGNSNSIAIRYFGVNSFHPSIAGVTTNNLAVLDFGTASSSVIRTVNQTPIIFGVNDTEIMRLTSAGLGVGTTTLNGAKVRISGGNLVLDDNARIAGYDSGTAGRGALYLNSSMNTESLNLGDVHISSAGSGVDAAAGDVYLVTPGALTSTGGNVYVGGISDEFGLSEGNLFVYGNAGIGTTTLSAKFTVAGDSYVTGNFGIGMPSDVKVSVKASTSAAAENMVEYYDSNSFLRSLVTDIGKQSWYLYDISTAAEVGGVSVAAVDGAPGFTFNTGALANQNRFNIINKGSWFNLGYDADGRGVGGLNIAPGGNVGVGTTTPTSQFQVGKNMVISQWTDVSKPQVLISGVDNEATVVALKIQDENLNEYFRISSTGAGAADAGRVYVAGNLGIGTTTPTSKLTVGGTVTIDGLTSGFGAGSICLSSDKEVVYSSASNNCLSSLRETKHDIAALSIPGLSYINSLKPVSFVYNDGDGQTRYGFIAEDTAAVDSHFATYNEKGKLSGIDDTAIIAGTVKAIQEQQVQIVQLNQSLAAINAVLASSTANVSQATSTAASEGIFSGVLASLESLGVKISNGFVHMKDLVVEKLTITESLTIGSESKPTAITVYDKFGKPGCMTVDDVNSGAFRVTPGICGQAAQITTNSSTVSGGSPAAASSSPEAQTAPITDSVSTATTSVMAEPVVATTSSVSEIPPASIPTHEPAPAVPTESTEAN